MLKNRLPMTEEKTDWNGIKNEVAEKAAANTGAATNVNFVVKGENKVPTSVQSAIRGKNMTVAFHTGTGIAYSITGTDISNTAALKEIDLTTRDYAKAIPENLVATKQSVVAKRQISVKDTGAFNVPVNMHVHVGQESAGKWANLYRYNAQTRQLEYCGSFNVTKNGQAMFAVNRGGEYLLTVTKEKLSETVTYTAGDYVVKSGDNMSVIARKHKMSLAELVRKNPQIKNINLIYPGQKINVN